MILLSVFILARLPTVAQQPDILLMANRDPILSISADVNRYINTFYTKDSLAPLLRDLEEEMRRGVRFSFSLAYHISEDFHMGFEYSHFHTQHETEPVFLLVNNIPLYGSIREEVTQNFYGVRMERTMEVWDFNLGVHITPGVIFYAEHGDYASYKYYITGQELAIDLGLKGIFEISPHWQAYVAATYLNSILGAPLYTDRTFTQVPGRPIQNSHFRFGIGLRFLILEPRFPVPPPAPKLPRNTREDERFR